MLTLITSPKPFVGEAKQNQLNALRSWKAIDSQIEILIFDAPEGASEAGEQVGATLVPDIEKSPSGAPSFNAMVSYAMRHARHDLFVYANCDILFDRTLLNAMLETSKQLPKFLLVGERLDLIDPFKVDTSRTGWREELKGLAEQDHLHTHGPSAIDYFGFPKGMWEGMAKVYMGRARCDQALLNFCLTNHIPIVDATFVALAVHQFHGYGHVRGGMQEVYFGQDRATMERLHGVSRSVPTIADADFVLSGDGSMKRSRCRGSKLREVELLLRYRYRYERLSTLVRGLEYVFDRPSVAGRGIAQNQIVRSWWV